MDRLLFFLDQDIRIDALEVAFFLRTFETALDEVFLTLVQLLLADDFPFVPIVQVHFVAKVWQREIGNDRQAGDPDNEFDEGEYHRKKSYLASNTAINDRFLFFEAFFIKAVLPIDNGLDTVLFKEFRSESFFEFLVISCN